MLFRSTDGFKFTCNRAGETTDRRLQEKYAKRTHKRDFKCNCEWAIRFRYINTCDKSGPIRITKVCPNHTFPCEPSSNQYVKARKVSGELTQYTKLALGDIVNYLYLDSFISPRLIRSILRRVYPNGQNLDYTQINNARLRAQIIVEKARLQDIDPTDLVSVERLPGLTRTLDFDAEHILDEAVIAADKLSIGVLNDCDGNIKLVSFFVSVVSKRQRIYI